MNVLAPFKVAEVVVTSLEALISAAALHLGEALPDGRALAADARSPIEAWFALLAAAGMLDPLAPMMQAEQRERFQGRIDALAAELARQHPDAKLPAGR